MKSVVIYWPTEIEWQTWTRDERDSYIEQLTSTVQTLMVTVVGFTERLNEPIVPNESR